MSHKETSSPKVVQQQTEGHIKKTETAEDATDNQEQTEKKVESCTRDPELSKETNVSGDKQPGQKNFGTAEYTKLQAQTETKEETSSPKVVQQQTEGHIKKTETAEDATDNQEQTEKKVESCTRDPELSKETNVSGDKQPGQKNFGTAEYTKLQAQTETKEETSSPKVVQQQTEGHIKKTETAEDATDNQEQTEKKVESCTRDPELSKETNVSGDKQPGQKNFGTAEYTKLQAQTETKEETSSPKVVQQQTEGHIKKTETAEDATDNQEQTEKKVESCTRDPELSKETNVSGDKQPGQKNFGTAEYTKLQAQTETKEETSSPKVVQQQTEGHIKKTETAEDATDNQEQTEKKVESCTRDPELSKETNVSGDKQPGQKNFGTAEYTKLQAQTETKEETSSPKVVQQQTEGHIKKTETAEDATDNQEQTEKKVESCTRDPELSKETNVSGDKQPGQKNFGTAEYTKLQAQTETKEETSSPKVVQQQTEGHIKKTETAEDATDNQEQTEKKVESCTRDPELSKETNVSGDKQPGQKNFGTAEYTKLQAQTETKEETSSPKVVQQQTEGHIKKTETAEDATDNQEQTEKKVESCTRDPELSKETNVSGDKQPGQKNFGTAEYTKLQAQTETKEETSSPKVVQQQTEGHIKKTETAEDATDNQEQTEKKVESCTRDPELSKETNVSGDKQPGQKNFGTAEYTKLQAQTETKERISMVILGNGQSLKEALITNILGEDLSELTKRKILTNTVIYEKETFVFSCTPDLRTPCDDITELLSSYPPPDMCLLVVENGFSTECVWQQIQDLSKKTGKPTEEFRVVLPMRHKPKDYPFKSCSLELLLQELDKVAEDKKPSSTRSVLGPQLQGQLQKTGKHTDTKVNLVLLGMAGTGKSASGNTILRKKVFMSKPSSNQVTTECQVAETEINGTHVRVIDTPDIFDDDIKPSVRDKHVKRCRELCEPGPSVFVLVMHVSRFTDGERDVLRKLEKAFGSKVHEHTVILFTRGDDLQEAEMSLEDFLHSCQPELKEIIQKCGNRCVVFENHRPESEQVEKLMDTVNMMLNNTC